MKMDFNEEEEDFVDDDEEEEEDDKGEPGEAAPVRELCAAQEDRRRRGLKMNYDEN